MNAKPASVPAVSREPASRANSDGIIDATRLAEMLTVPVSWVRSRCRQRTPKAERIAHLQFGRYVRFDTNSPAFRDWLAAREEQ